MKYKQLFLAILLSVFLLLNCSSSEDIKVLHQVTGGIHTNCYLLYGTKTKDAALFDVAGPIDTLLNFIKENKLNLKYFFCTHGHPDHIIGLPDIRDQHPEAKVCIYKTDYDDIFTGMEWAIKNLGQDFIDYLLSDPERRKIYDFEEESFGEPDIFIEGNQIFKFGHSEIKAIHSPGHSPGSMCFYIDGKLFSGDVLFYRSVGRTDVQHSSREDQIKSVRRLYSLFPDVTKVYPGHGKFTDIGSEKRENKFITVDGGELENR